MKAKIVLPSVGDVRLNQITPEQMDGIRSQADILHIGIPVYFDSRKQVWPTPCNGIPAVEFYE